jgi:deazaflavin-dependent oxidoreductase (nitroreductase family)
VKFARVGNIVSRPRFIATRITRLHAKILRMSGGRLKRSFLFAGGQPVLAITTTGRKSGEARSTVIACMRDGDNLVVVPSYAGLDRPPAWWLNLEADPRAEVDFRGEHCVVRARRASAEEERRLWPRIVEQYAGFEQYRRMTDREIPVVILEREGTPPPTR